VVTSLSGPVLAAAPILRFLSMYNRFLRPVIGMPQECYRPVMIRVRHVFRLDAARGEVTVCLTLVTVPVLASSVALQRAFIASIAPTGVEG